MNSLKVFIYEKLKLTPNSKLDLIGFKQFSQLFEKEKRITYFVPIEDDFITIGETDLYRVTNKVTKDVLNYCYCFYVTHTAGPNEDETEYYQIVISKEKEDEIEIFIGWTNNKGESIDGNETYVLKQSPSKLTKNQYEKIIDFLEYSISDIQEFDFDDYRFNTEEWEDYLEKYKHSI